MSTKTLANFTALQRKGVEIKRSANPALLMRGAEDEEASLVAGLKKRDEAAFTDMVKRHQRMLLSVALRITRNPNDAEEVVQDALLKVFQNIESFRGESRFRTWLTRITMNEALMRLRRKTGTFLSLDEAGEDCAKASLRQLQASEYTPEETYSLQEIQGLLQGLISQIGLLYQPVMQLRLHLDLSQAEMAKHLRLTPATIKSRLFRARRQLRDALDRHCASHKESMLHRRQRSKDGQPHRLLPSEKSQFLEAAPTLDMKVESLLRRPAA